MFVLFWCLGVIIIVDGDGESSEYCSNFYPVSTIASTIIYFSRFVYSASRARKKQLWTSCVKDK